MSYICLLIGHKWGRWKFLYTTEVYGNGFEMTELPTKVKHNYRVECERCGRIKIESVRG